MVAKGKMTGTSLNPALVMPSLSCLFKKAKERTDLSGSKLHMHGVVCGPWPFNWTWIEPGRVTFWSHFTFLSAFQWPGTDKPAHTTQTQVCISTKFSKTINQMQFSSHCVYIRNPVQEKSEDAQCYSAR